MKQNIHLYLKLTGALLLLVSLTMPVSSCTRLVDEDGRPVYPSTIDRDQWLSEGVSVREVTTYDYVLLDFDITDWESWLLLAAFLWPAAFVFVLHKMRPGKPKTVLRLVELAFVVGSAFLIICASTILATMEIGAYVALFALSIYLIGSVWADVEAIISWRRRKMT